MSLKVLWLLGFRSPISYRKIWLASNWVRFNESVPGFGCCKQFNLKAHCEHKNQLSLARSTGEKSSFRAKSITVILVLGPRFRQLWFHRSMRTGNKSPQGPLSFPSCPKLYTFCDCVSCNLTNNFATTIWHFRSGKVIGSTSWKQNWLSN